MEDILGVSLSNPVDELEVLYESIIDFENLKKNGFDLIGHVAS